MGLSSWTKSVSLNVTVLWRFDCRHLSSTSISLKLCCLILALFPPSLSSWLERDIAILSCAKWTFRLELGANSAAARLISDDVDEHWLFVSFVIIWPSRLDTSLASFPLRSSWVHMRVAVLDFSIDFIFLLLATAMLEPLLSWFGPLIWTRVGAITCWAALLIPSEAEKLGEFPAELGVVTSTLWSERIGN